jgi:hypothetical protein
MNDMPEPSGVPDERHRRRHEVVNQPYGFSQRVVEAIAVAQDK